MPQTYNCIICGDTFENYPSCVDEDAPTCFAECGYKKRDRDRTVSVNCDNCGAELTRPKCQVERNERNFCDQTCNGAYHSGENCPNWEGGSDKFFDHKSGTAWESAVMERDDYTCQDCGSVEPLVAHHIKRRKNCKHFEKYAVWNGVTLCRSCHAERHEGEDVYEMLKWIAGQS